MKPVIAIDIDEVLALHNVELVDFHNKNYGSSYKLEDYTSDHWAEIWGVPPEEAERRAVEFHATGVHNRLGVIEHAQASLQQLSRNYRLAAVTVRRRVTIEGTHAWMDKYFPGLFESIRFVHAWEDPDAPSKAEVCQEIGARWLVDDSVKNCRLAAEAHIVAVLFGNYPWNQISGELPAGVVRCANWPAVLKYFERLQEASKGA